MIPKTIHYCWFGNNSKTKLAKKCIDSWARHMPDYRIVEWNENNFDVNSNPYTRMCYNEKKYAFLSDYVRLIVIYEHGGLYFDTDVEVLKSFDELLDNRAFFGFETKEDIATGLGFGAEKGNVVVKMMIEEYAPLLDGKHGVVVCPDLNTAAMQKLGLERNGKKQIIDGTLVLPIDYLNPFDNATGVLRKTQNTYSIHWYGKSWMSKRKIMRSRLTRIFHRILGINCFDFLKNKKV